MSTLHVIGRPSLSFSKESSPPESCAAWDGPRGGNEGGYWDSPRFTLFFGTLNPLTKFMCEQGVKLNSVGCLPTSAPPRCEPIVVRGAARWRTRRTAPPWCSRRRTYRAVARRRAVDVQQTRYLTYHRPELQPCSVADRHDLAARRVRRDEGSGLGQNLRVRCRQHVSPFTVTDLFIVGTLSSLLGCSGIFLIISSCG